MIFKRCIYALVYLSCLTLSTSCSTVLQSTAASDCFDCEELVLNNSANIPLLGLRKPAALSNHEHKHLLHIYFEGDGQPWDKGLWPSRNPTSQERLALQMMSRDTNDSIYLHRPCYGYKKVPANCHPNLWTSARYGQQVVSTMNEALDTIRLHHPEKAFVFIGFSGGGTLAMLLAHERNDIAAIITVAANLDHQTWSHTQGFLPLSHSLSLLEKTPLPESIIRWHYVGTKDSQVPSSITIEGAKKDPFARIIEIPEFTHQCCWVNIWPEILKEFHTQLDGTK